MLSLRVALLTVVVLLVAAPAHAGVRAVVTAYPVGDGQGWPLEVAAGDFDGDGLIDLVSADLWTAGGDFSILRGVGGGAFAAARVYGARRFASVATADFDEDGLSDIALASDMSSTGVFVELNDGHGGFDEVALPTASSGSIATGDLDRDGHADLVAGTTAGAAVMLGDGEGGFSDPALYLGGAGGYWKVATGDIDGDGRDDVIVPVSNGTAVLRGSSDGALLPARVTAHATCCVQSIAVGHFDGDARADLVFTQAFGMEASVFLGGPDGDLRAAPAVAFRTGGHAAAGDADGDGRDDLVLASGGGSLALALGTGTGTFGPLLTLPGGAQFARPSAIDVDADGYDDLVVGDYRSSTVIVGRNARAVTATPSALSFGLLSPGATSDLRRVTVRSDGLPPVTVTGIELGGAAPGAFRLIDDTCTGLRLAPDATCDVSLAAAPSTAGAHYAELLVRSDAGGEPSRVTLSASGLPPITTVRPAPRDEAGPVVSLRAGTLRRARLHRGLTTRARCSEPCTLQLKLYATAGLMRRIGLRADGVLARGRARLSAAGEARVTMKLSRRVQRALRRVRTARLTLGVLAADASGNETLLEIRVRLRS